MADLPPERLEHSKPPFTYIGLDCFGLFYVKLGRSEVKRYGCVFTCLTTRAVHIEKLNILETDAFLNGFRRFMSRRGQPEKVWSDNGTNFTGGQAELSRSMSQLNKDMIYSHCARKDIVWVFNPPHASHMGGIWERMIRSIRKVLNALLRGNHRLTDEVLETLFCEVENIINSRPITKSSDDVSDSRALTPNHLLLLRDGATLLPGKFGSSGMYPRRWRHVQHLADQFWRKWVKEYLPELQRRSKWIVQSRNIKIGDLLLVVNENTPRGLWPLGLVIEVNKGRDGLVRSAKVRTK
ncbi:PREDICTED: uncharacterized protein LOC106817151 [Priapulus caudatus]|uniref:Uncharacterized protein LOC106817151 n=1 Tax=Priapulus caudatus TaxID=37621 RepID=A0ABM1EYL8_PRICU|nr:PREDICTED: uncharacterized protein LOC106817151 [Priapulus caudatus]